MRRQMWFGTRGHERWVPAPVINPSYERIGYAASAQYLGGGFGSRESKNAHNAYTLSWGPSKNRDQIRAITDFADGVFDATTDVDLIFWIDPMAADKNVLNQAWATPALGCSDAPPLITRSTGRGRPVAETVPSGPVRYPALGAHFLQRFDSLTREQYIPIPPGYSAWVGVHGDAAAADRVIVQRVNGYSEVGAPVAPGVLGVVPTRVNTEFSSVDSSGIVLRFASVGMLAEYTLYGLMVQILPAGQIPDTGDFVSGQGHSGCQFIGKGTRTPYSARLDRMALTIRLEETGMYL